MCYQTELYIESCYLDKGNDAFGLNHNMNPNFYPRYIQNGLLHHKLYTRGKLVTIDIIKEASCTKCGSLESTEHLIYEWESSENLWCEIETWISNIGFTNHQIGNRKRIIKGPEKETFYHRSHIVCEWTIHLWTPNCC